MKNLDQFSPGAIWVALWGYEQTNLDYYQVVKRTQKTVTVREIESDKNTHQPLKNHFRGEPIRRKIHQGYICINDVVMATPYEGETCAVDALAYR